MKYLRGAAAGYPEIFWPILVWLISLIGCLITTTVSAYQMQPGTYMYVTAHLLCYVVPALLFGGKLPEDRRLLAGGSPEGEEPRGVIRSILLAAFGGLILFFFLYFYLRRDFLGVDTSDARHLRSFVNTGGRIGRLYELAAPSALFVAFAAARWRLLRPKAVGFYGLTAAGLSLAMLFSGARFEMVPLILVFIAGILIFHTRLITQNLLRGASILVFIFGLLAAGNTVLNMSAFKGGGGGAERVATEERGLVIAKTLGIDNPPGLLAIGIGLCDEYIFRPIAYLDFYFYTATAPPAYGGHQFFMFAYRIGFRDGGAIKEEVDAYYNVIGIEGNVWGTAIREMAIDFTPTGSLIAFLCIGVTTGVSKRLSTRSIASQFVLSYCVAFMLFSPMSSALRAVSMQATFYVVLVVFMVEVLPIFNRRPSISLVGPGTARGKMIKKVPTN